MKPSFSRFFTTVNLACLFLSFLLLFSNALNSYIFAFSWKAKASAHTAHESLSTALLLKKEASYHEKIYANQTLYFYIIPIQNMTLSVSSANCQFLKITFLSESGNPVSLSETQKSSTRFFLSNHSKDNKLFIKIFNKQSYNTTFTLSFQKNHSDHNSSKTTKEPVTSFPIDISKSKDTDKKTSSPDTSPIPPHNHTYPAPSKEAPINKPANTKRSFTRKKKQNILSTSSPKKYTLYPQFLILSPKDVQKIAIQNIAALKNKKSFSILSTNPSVATVNPMSLEVTAHSEGISILYFQDKKHPQITSSCFIRVIKQ